MKEIIVVDTGGTSPASTNAAKTPLGILSIAGRFISQFIPMKKLVPNSARWEFLPRDSAPCGAHLHLHTDHAGWTGPPHRAQILGVRPGVEKSERHRRATAGLSSPSLAKMVAARINPIRKSPVWTSHIKSLHHTQWRCRHRSYTGAYARSCFSYREWRSVVFSRCEIPAIASAC